MVFAPDARRGGAQMADNQYTDMTVFTAWQATDDNRGIITERGSTVPVAIVPTDEFQAHHAPVGGA
jgi:hypothetical protein